MFFLKTVILQCVNVFPSQSILLKNYRPYGIEVYSVLSSNLVSHRLLVIMEQSQNYCSTEFLVTVIFQPHSEGETVLLAVCQYFRGSIFYIFFWYEPRALQKKPMRCDEDEV